ncbi:MAG TPA: BatD family protein, partial [bacterium]|nr:BatD family protein [bacterium]
RVSLDGQYGLNMLPPPTAPSLKDFKLFDPKSGDIAPHPEKPGWSRRTFEYILVPHTPGDFSIPPFEFSYFDTDTDQYRVLRTTPFDVHVDPAPGGGVITRIGDDGREIQLLNVDIRYIKTGTGISPWHAPYRRPWFAAVMLLPLIAVPVVTGVDRRRRRMEGDTAFAREVRARSVSGRRFAEARSLLERGNVDPALDNAAAAFARYLADRLSLPLGGITLGKIREALAERRVDNDVIARVTQYWQTLETTRYAPVQTTETAAAELLAAGRQLVDDLERVKFRKCRSRKGDLR